MFSNQLYSFFRKSPDVDKTTRQRSVSVSGESGSCKGIGLNNMLASFNSNEVAKLKAKPPKAEMDKENVMNSSKPVPKPRRALQSLSTASLNAQSAGHCESKKVHFECSDLGSAESEADQVHRLELVHFVFRELRQHKGKPVAISEIRKLLQYFHPKLVEFLSTVELPLDWQMEATKVKGSGFASQNFGEIKLDMQLTAFLLNYTDLVTVHRSKKEVELTKNILKNVDDITDKLTAGFKACVIMLVKSLLVKHDGQLAVAQLRKTISEPYAYLAQQVIPRTSALESLIIQSWTTFFIMDGKVFLKGAQASNSGVPNSSKTSLTPLNPRRSSTSTLPRAKSFVNLAPHVDKIKAEPKVEPKVEPKFELPQVNRYDHGRHCICDQDVDKIFSNISEPMFDNFASLHVRCLISSMKRKYVVKKNFSVKVDGECQTEITISPKLFI
ncbi:hypothetical protein HDE_04142 [Halotydeus destructor]|nr:hypothetical protein HDE_04142 [Halotydeus destructor]